ncbi:hypothetical protein WG926_24040 [Tistrella sp. BH-R2-4]|uniref:Uncharacterized protein n=1 Tax=Tistrella arctica TaxID=3133430 RepID=A0ABU9YRI3_9PROT
MAEAQSRIRRIWQAYVDAVCRNTPIYRRSVPRLTAGVILLLISISISIAAILGENLVVGILAVLGASLIGAFKGDIRQSWLERKRQREEKPN